MPHKKCTREFLWSKEVCRFQRWFLLYIIYCTSQDKHNVLADFNHWSCGRFPLAPNEVILICNKWGLPLTGGVYSRKYEIFKEISNSRGDALTNIGLSVNCDLVEVFLLKWVLQYVPFEYLLNDPLKKLSDFFIQVARSLN